MKKYITKQSGIKGAGKGLFTKDFFKKGEVIGLAHVDDQPASEIGKNHNHNEKNPTAYSKKINNKRFIYASKDLNPGEEITTNYRLQPELEQPEDFMRKGGSVLRLPNKKNSKGYSRSLSATNKLFTQNFLFAKPKSRKNKVFDPNSKYYAEGGSLLTKKVTCKKCGWKWDAEDGGKDITTCHECGGQGLIHAQDGGNKDAMTGMMKARLAYANEFGNPAAERMINLPDNPYQFDNGDTGTHYMASYDNYAVPQIQDENGVLQLGDYGPESNEAIRFDSDEDANYFAENYKDVSPGFIEADLDEDEIEEYRRGGYIVEEIDNFQKGGISKVSSNSSDNTRVNYQKPLVKSFNRSNNLESFYKKEREKDLQKQKDATAYHDKTQKVKQIQSFGEFINQDVRGIPTYKQHMAQIANDKKLLKKELKPYFETEKEIDQFLAEQSRPSAENNYHDGPIQMVYPEKYFIGPGGGMIGNIKNFGKNTFNLGKKVLSNPYVSGGLNAYFAAEGIKEFSDPNSLTRKSMSRAYDDPTGSNIGDAAWDVGMNSLNFVGLPFGKAIKDSKNLINDTYNAGKGSNIFFNFSNEANAARKLQNIGLLKKNIDPKIFGKYPNLAQNVTKRLLKDYNTTYRAVYPNVKKMGFEDMVNMAKSGYDINDPMQVVEYMTTTIPISNTGAYRAGLDLHSSQDALYTGKFKTPKEAFEKLDFYGNYIAAVRPKMDFSKGTLNEWIDQYYTNKLFALNKNPNKGFFALRNPKAYESGSLFKPGAIGFTREHDFWPYIGNKGEKVLEHVKTYNLNQKQKGGITNDYVELDLTPKEVKRYKERGYIVEEIN